MKIGVRAKLFAVSVALILSVGVPVGAYLESELQAWMETRIEENLTRHAGAVRDLIEVAPDIGSVRVVDVLADTMGQTMSVRVTVVGADGSVLGDSEVRAKDVLSLENHGQRPEILAASQDGLGRSRRHSTTVHTDMLYIAVPYQRPSERGVVRVAMPLDEVDVALGHLRTILVVAGLLGLIMALLMSGLSSHLLSRTLRKLVRAARVMAGGNRDQRISVRSGDEIAGLATSLNRMAEDLEATITALAGERDRMEAVLEGITEGIVALDDRQRVTLVNASARTFFPTAADPVGCTLAELVRAPEIAALVEAIRLGQSAESEFDLPGPAPRRVMALAAPQRATDGAVIVLRDVTELRHLETIRRDFVANVSHELRTPVSVITANVETLLGPAPIKPERRAQFMEAIARNAKRLSSLIADLLEIAQAEAGEISLELRALPIRADLQSAIDGVDAGAQPKALTLELSAPAELTATFDAKALEQVLLNLLDNAVKYTPEGGHICLHAAACEGHVRIEVRDNGPGIEAQHRERVFERFFRVDPGRSRALGGTGLGLSIVRHLVEAMGGQVGLDPASPRGSIFWFTLPPGD